MVSQSGRVEVVVGLQWGDEGKGRVADALAPGFDVFVRGQGGANSGHTVVIDGKRHELFLLPTGMLRPCKTCVLGSGVLIDPELLLAELRNLQEGGMDRASLVVSETAHAIMPYHKLLDRARDRSRGRRRPPGSHDLGMDSACADKYARRGVRIEDVLDEDILRERLEANLDEANTLLSKVYDEEPLPFHETYSKALSWGRALAPYVCDASLSVSEALAEGKGVLFEGAQGTLLDVDLGTYPHVTNSCTAAAGACTGLGVGPSAIDRVIGVLKAYCTRAGEGPFPTEEHGERGDGLRTRGAEFDSATGAARRCGWLDLPALRYAARVNGASSLAITKLDILAGVERIPVCVSYEIDGAEVGEFPCSSASLARAVPRYEHLEGWRDDISRCTSFGDLPKNARDYVRYVEAAVGTPVSMVGVGPGREQTILLDS